MEAFGAVAAVVAGVAWIAVGLLRYLLILDFLGRSESLILVVELLLIVAPIGTLRGLVGLHAWQRVSYGRLGIAGFLSAFVWTALLAVAAVVGGAGRGPAGRVGIVGEVVAGVGAAVVGEVGRGVIVAVAVVGAVGLALMGIATLRVGALPRWCGWLLIIGAAGSLLFGGLVLGPVWLALGYALWSRRGGPDGQTTRRTA